MRLSTGREYDGQSGQIRKVDSDGTPAIGIERCWFDYVVKIHSFQSRHIAEGEEPTVQRLCRRSRAVHRGYLEHLESGKERRGEIDGHKTEPKLS